MCPDPIQHVIACNDDALKSIKLILSALAQAIIDTKNDMMVADSKGDEEDSFEDEGEESGVEFDIEAALKSKEGEA